MNPPSPSVPTIEPDLPVSNTGNTEVVVEVDNLPENPSSVDVGFTFGSSSAITSVELVGKQANADIGDGAATLTHAISFADGVLSFGVTQNHSSFTITRVIIVAGERTFTFD